MARGKKKKKKAKGQARRKQSAALKRAKRARAVKKQREARAQAPLPIPTASPPLVQWDRPRHHDVLHPAVLSPEGPQPPTPAMAPAPGPEVVAARFGDTGVALYRRAEDGSYPLASPFDLPEGVEVSWWGEEMETLEASALRIGWHELPSWQDTALVGRIIVRDLVQGAEGLVWSPVEPVSLTPRADREWDVRVGDGLLEGSLGSRGFQWSSSSDTTHVRTVAVFLGHKASRLWEQVQAGPRPSSSEEPPRALVDAIRGPSPRYKRAAMDALVARQDAVTPLLLAHLDAIYQSLVGQAYDLDDFSSLYTLVLLIHFKCAAAHERILALARLPRDSFESALSAFLTEGYDTALLATCAGDVSGILDLLLDRQVNGYLRSQAAEALAGAVLLGWAEREETLASLASLLSPEHAPEGSYLWTGVGSAMLWLYPVEYVDELVRACEDWLIEPIMFDSRHVLESIEEGPARATTSLRCIDQLQQKDVHRWLEWWACFREVGQEP